jgi:hypothetical protein
MTNPSDHLLDDYYTPTQLVEKWRGTVYSVSALTLTRWRRLGKGPDFIRVGEAKHVYYPKASVAAFEMATISAPLETTP